MSASSYGYVILVTLAIGAISTCLANDDDDDDGSGGCDDALGMRSKDIPDSALSASSSYDNVVGPLNSRIRTERQGGAWCPKAVVSRDSYEWLQIDFDELKVITAVETQGRYGNGQGQEFTPHYVIEYQREDGDRWIRHRNRIGQELMTGNTNPQTAERRALEPMVVVRRVRFVPFSHHPRTVCMRVELYGCKAKAGILSYDMPQGHKRGHDLDFSDSTYDGIQLNDRLSGGLGKLTDLEEGHSNFRLDVHQTGRRGFEWITWKKDSPLTDPVEIHFRFDAPRRFSEVRVHCNNLFSKDVKVFKAVEVQFSVGGRFYGQGQGRVMYVYPEDEVLEEARYVEVPIPGVVGRFVKMSLYFNSRWMMISEIQFESELANGTYADEEPPTDPPQTSTLVQSATPAPEETSDWPEKTQIDESETNFPNGFLDPYDEEFEDDDEEAEDNNEGQDDSDYPHTEISTTDERPSDLKAPNKSYVGVLAGTTATVVIATAAICTCLVLWYRRRRRKRYLGNNYTSALHKSVFVVDRFGKPAPPVTRPRPSSEEQRFIRDLIGEQIAQDPPVTFDVTGGEVMTSGRQPPPRPLPAPPSLHLEGCPAPEEGREGRRMGADSVVSLEGIGRWTLVNFPRERLRVVEKLGEGAYKEIRVCELTSDVTSHNHRTSGATNRDDSLLVTVKSLKRDASIQDRKDFEEEVDRAFSFDHCNVVRFYGLCEHGISLEMVLEYSQYGTLHQFLQQRTTIINTADIGTKYDTPFSQGYLIHMATEIASGMKYLESRGVAHRDLATRNCLVSQQRTVKITDMASDCHRYTSHYYHVIGGRTPLPIRWMAWESVLLRNFSSRSDVWSFGVTLWEVLTCARTLPFDHLSNQQVIDNCCHYYQADGLHVRHPQPTGCAKEVYDLMVECWNADASQRPTFREIHMFLSRKNLGFNPYEEPTTTTECGIDNLAIGDVA